MYAGVQFPQLLTEAFKLCFIKLFRIIIGHRRDAHQLRQALYSPLCVHGDGRGAAPAPASGLNRAARMHNTAHNASTAASMSQPIIKTPPFCWIWLVFIIPQAGKKRKRTPLGRPLCMWF